LGKFGTGLVLELAATSLHHALLYQPITPKSVINQTASEFKVESINRKC